MQQKINQLLEEVSLKISSLREAKRLFSDQLAPEFSIFDYLRTDEMGLSRCIATLLDPKGTHGQGCVFLKIFVDMFLQPQVRIWADGDCKIILEKQANAQRRIDIYLAFENGIIGIENKPWASCQENQLSDYATYLEKQNINWLLIFISNRDPHESSISASNKNQLENSGNLLHINYSELVAFLELCANKSKALVVRIFIEELTKFIRKNINGELEMNEENETSKSILKSKENLSSAFQVSTSMDKVKLELLNKLRDELKISLITKGFNLEWNVSNFKRYNSFNIGFTDSPQTLSLCFNFEQSNLCYFFWGISRKNETYFNNNIWSEINELMSDHFNSGKRSEHWPWYTDDIYRDLGANLENWWNNETPWLAILDESLVKKITDLAIRVHKLFQDNGKLHLFI